MKGIFTIWENLKLDCATVTNLLTDLHTDSEKQQAENFCDAFGIHHKKSYKQIPSWIIQISQQKLDLLTGDFSLTPSFRN